jgi:hypothetical protein
MPPPRPEFAIDQRLGAEGLADFVPEGLDDRSQAIYCLVSVSKRDPSRRDGLILTSGVDFWLALGTNRPNSESRFLPVNK